MSTLKMPASLPSAVADAEALRQAFEGWGTNEKLIIQVLGHRNSAQRKAIKDAYKQLFQEDLLKRLEGETTRHFERALLLWTLEPADRDAVLSFDGIKKYHEILIEVSCTRSSAELFSVRQAYHARYKKSLEEDVAAHIHGNFGRLLVGLVTAYRYEGPEVNMRLAKTEAKLLHDAIKDKAFDHEDVNRILTTRSKPQLNATFNHYKDEFGVAINKDLKEGGDKEFLHSLRNVIKCISFPEKYFAKAIRLAIDKLGTDEEALLRVIVTRAEKDLLVIKEAYAARTSKNLDHAIAADTHGDYEDFLLALLGKE